MHRIPSASLAVETTFERCHVLYISRDYIICLPLQSVTKLSSENLGYQREMTSVSALQREFQRRVQYLIIEEYHE